MKEVLSEIAKVNKLNFKPQGVYDVWVIQNLIQEFEKKSKYLDEKTFKLIAPIVKEVKDIDYRKFTKGLIHGDVQRSNVLVNKRGDIRLIDFSIMEYNAISFDIALYLSLFCINPLQMKAEEVQTLINWLVGEYSKTRKLTARDKNIIPLFMRGTYAANALAGIYELKYKGNDTRETKYWINLGIEGMKLLSGIKD